ncbi:uncharacterized protein AMSG_06716 [Thecamonas trahens ATCC 50062]|uniref:Uncharacterized protein n=1 Tax=Thecamonas trahens ATCC 50062 TaxID=461836 RepID=A0A0L0DHN3_THETB|nr:hypothetical protein AMSG_06716 [Thecamonas trahens ATCC 50062]KNC50813.1 hypothetical protein AMSG_06716 [Thecamonas trahens ATCC 50062]|eukprot:XP_013756768.1 hypothetical protein AMSG_06716 [Thecamonas trahens ATCC 50062]
MLRLSATARVRPRSLVAALSTLGRARSQRLLAARMAALLAGGAPDAAVAAFAHEAGPDPPTAVHALRLRALAAAGHPEAAEAAWDALPARHRSLATYRAAAEGLASAGAPAAAVAVAEAMASDARIVDAQVLGTLAATVSPYAPADAHARVAALVVNALSSYGVVLPPSALVALLAGDPELLTALPPSLPAASLPDPVQIEPLLKAVALASAPDDLFRALRASPLLASSRARTSPADLVVFDYAAALRSSDYVRADKLQAALGDASVASRPSPSALRFVVDVLDSRGLVDRAVDLARAVSRLLSPHQLASEYDPALRALLGMFIRNTHEPGLDAALTLLGRSAVSLKPASTAALVKTAARVSPIWAHTVLDKLGASSHAGAVRHVVAAYADAQAPTRALALLDEAVPDLCARTEELYAPIVAAYAADNYWDQLDALLADDAHLRKLATHKTYALACRAALEAGSAEHALKYYTRLLARASSSPLRLEMYALGLELAHATRDFDLCLSILDSVRAHGRYANERLVLHALATAESPDQLEDVAAKLAHPKLVRTPRIDEALDALVFDTFGGSPDDLAAVDAVLFADTRF